MKRGKSLGLNRDLNPGPPAPEAGIIPLDHWALHDRYIEIFPSDGDDDDYDDDDDDDDDDDKTLITL